MSEPVPNSLPDRAAELELHRRLLGGDPTATDDLATIYLDSLAAWLEEHNEQWVQDFCGEAAGEAILSLMRNPASYDPEKLSLLAYLRMSAQGDLRNLLAREGKHHQQRIPMADVEDSDEAGKYLGQQDDPSLPLRLQEEEQLADRAVPASVWNELAPTEQQVLRLMQRGVRDHQEFAVACGVTELPLEQQRREVKRLKDRLKIRLKRARRES